MNCNTYLLSCKLLQLGNSHEARNASFVPACVVAMFGGRQFPSGFACACWCSLWCTSVGVKAKCNQISFWLGLGFFLMQEEQNIHGTNLLSSISSFLWRCIFWSLMLITFMSYCLSSSGDTPPPLFFFLPSALELPLSKSKSAVFPLPLLTRLSLHWVCSRSFIRFGLSMCC